MPTALSAASVLITHATPSGREGTLGTFGVAIYSDAGGTPNSILSVLSGNNYPTNAGTYVYTNQTALVLAANTTGSTTNPAKADGVGIIGYTGSGGTVAIPDTINGLPVIAIATNAFYRSGGATNGVTNCTHLSAIYFSGNAPAVDGTDFGSDASATAYYLPGTTGWDNFTAVTGIPAVPWNPQAQTGNGSFGVVSNAFGFNITGGGNLVVVVMACTNLAHPVWTPVSTNTLNAGVSHFSDPQWMNYPCRFYGFSFP